MQSKVIITLESNLKEKKAVPSDIKSELDKVMENLINYINNDLTNNKMFGNMKVVNLKIEGEKENDSKFQRSFDF